MAAALCLAATANCAEPSAAHTGDLLSAQRDEAMRKAVHGDDGAAFDLFSYYGENGESAGSRFGRKFAAEQGGCKRTVA